MRIRVTPKDVFPGVEISPNGIHEFSIGALADHLIIGDGIVLYEPVLKYELIDLFVEAFNDKSWTKRPIQDLSKRYAKFDLSKRTLLPTWGYVYLLKSSDAYKIGMSKDTAQRKKRIERDEKLNLELIHEFPSNDYERAEATLHLDFAHCRRKRTEFFDLIPSEVERIQAISSMDFLLP